MTPLPASPFISAQQVPAVPSRATDQSQAVAFGQPSSLDDPNHWLFRAVGPKTKAGVAVTAATALQVPSVYACVNRIANPVGRFPISIVQPQSSGGGMVEVTQHPMSSAGDFPLSLRPNERMSSRTLRKAMQSHALLWGNGYSEIQRNNAGEAIGLWPLMPWATRPMIEEGVFFYRSMIDGKQFDFDSGDVIHIMDQSQDGLVGLSQIALARQAVGLALATEEFGAKFFANDAKSGGFLMHPGRLSAAAQSNLGKEADKRSDPGARLERQGGLDNAHRVKVLEEGMKFVQTMIPPEDAQFLQTRGMQIAEIARIYDVPLILLQHTEGTTTWGSGIEQLMIGFVRQTIAPWIGAWEQEMNFKLFTRREREQRLSVKFNMKEYLRGDSAARAALYTALFGVGAYSPNRILELEDEEGFGADGDEHFVQAGYVPISRAVNPPPVQGGVAA